MVFTPPTGDASHFSFLYHAEWNGLTLSDVVFPTFLVTSGVSLALLLREGPVTRTTKVRLVRRMVLLVVIGLVYNAYGDSGFDLDRLRITGVLQLIGLSGALAACAVLATRRRDGTDRPWLLGGAVVALVGAYGLGLELLDDRCGGERLGCSPYGFVDRTLLGRAHLYRGGTVDYDPEGVVIVGAAAALVLIGYVAGRHLRRTRDGRLLAVAGAALVLVAAVLDELQPVNKRLFTPAFVAVAAGIALVGLAVSWLVLDRWASGRASDVVTTPFVALGRNALVVYLTEHLVLRTMTLVDIGDQTAEAWFLERLPIDPPGVHLAYGVAVLAVVLCVTLPLHAKRRYLAL